MRLRSDATVLGEAGGLAFLLSSLTLDHTLSRKAKLKELM